MIALVGSRRDPPSPIRLLSRSSYTVYLYHLFFVLLVSTATVTLDPGMRIVIRLVVGLAGPVLVCLVGQRLLGSWARPLLGS